ncbi:1,2-phenylacetyl-CoA epoxidase subunit PaaC [Aureispira anguillae]|uniref:Phenylacetate-CoA oxygenase subunit PaaC n=1 Tax=Aureispira anguillae TaxID=2864201 RepID=A0A915YEU8_9BACT|nr:1,2-phenylacetyl-CoA epoxidase subunit PaaC [Aureispira anguillae]BDS11701.1 phenylacetate-CoA oxygenase subunit PaaC [Aureispira anguillae]
MENNKALFEYILRIADNALILGHRVSEWCGHGPSLETDIGLTNIALDLVGHARVLLQYAAKVEGKGRTDDALAFTRDTREFKNVLLVEQANGNFADTMARQFLFDTFNYHFFAALCDSKDEELVAIAKKSLKELTYHYRYSAEWVIRLGDGTEESHEKMQTALNEAWDYVGELFAMDEIDQQMIQLGIGVDLNAVKELWNERVDAILTEATLAKPEDGWMQKGGKQGKHSEQMGFILTEMQWMQRAYPGLEW